MKGTDLICLFGVVAVVAIALIMAMFGLTSEQVLVMLVAILLLAGKMTISQVAEYREALRSLDNFYSSIPGNGTQPGEQGQALTDAELDQADSVEVR